MKDYIELHNNPFSSQLKAMLHVEHLYKYLTDQESYPFFMEISPTVKCNLKCQWCISQNLNENNLSIDIEVLEKFLKEYKEVGGEAITFSGGGEPTLYDHFERAVMFANSHKIKLGLMTNGVYKESLNFVIGNSFEWVRFSLDTVNKDKYKKWKGADRVDVVLKNIESLNSYKVKIGVNCNVSQYHAVEDIREMYEAVKDKVSYVQFRPVLPRFYKKEDCQINNEVWNFLTSEYKGYANVNLSNDKLNDLTRNQLFNFEKCDGHFFSPVLDNMGNICVCMYHPYDKDFIFGNIYNNSFSEIWKSNQRKKVIDKIGNIDYRNKCQVCCKLCEINKLLDCMRHRYNFDNYSFI